MLMDVIQCPHCSQYIIIESLGCGIFRCGIMKETFKQIPSHSSKEYCDHLKNNDLIYGCGKSFRIIADEIVKCSYI
jgi:DNA-directed RNA polymerase subunit RPC12/RpoP